MQTDLQPAISSPKGGANQNGLNQDINYFADENLQDPVSNAKNDVGQNQIKNDQTANSNPLAGLMDQLAQAQIQRPMTGGGANGGDFNALEMEMGADNSTTNNVRPSTSGLPGAGLNQNSIKEALAKNFAKKFNQNKVKKSVERDTKQSINDLRLEFSVQLAKLYENHTRKEGAQECFKLIQRNCDNPQALRVFLGALTDKGSQVANADKKVQGLQLHAQMLGFLAKCFKQDMIDPLDKPPSLSRTLTRVQEAIYPFFKENSKLVWLGCGVSLVDILDNCLVDKQMLLNGNQSIMSFVFDPLMNFHKGGHNTMMQQGASYCIMHLIQHFITTTQLDFLDQIHQPILQNTTKFKVDNESQLIAIKLLIQSLGIRVAKDYLDGLVNLCAKVINTQANLPFHKKAACDLLTILGENLNDFADTIVPTYQQTVMKALEGISSEKQIDLSEARNNAKNAWNALQTIYDTLDPAHKENVLASIMASNLKAKFNKLRDQVKQTREDERKRGRSAGPSGQGDNTRLMNNQISEEINQSYRMTTQDFLKKGRGQGGGNSKGLSNFSPSQSKDKKLYEELKRIQDLNSFMRGGSPRARSLNPKLDSQGRLPDILEGIEESNILPSQNQSHIQNGYFNQNQQLQQQLLRPTQQNPRALKSSPSRYTQNQIPQVNSNGELVNINIPNNQYLNPRQQSSQSPQRNQYLQNQFPQTKQMIDQNGNIVSIQMPYSDINSASEPQNQNQFVNQNNLGQVQSYLGQPNQQLTPQQNAIKQQIQSQQIQELISQGVPVDQAQAYVIANSDDAQFQQVINQQDNEGQAQFVPVTGPYTGQITLQQQIPNSQNQQQLPQLTYMGDQVSFMPNQYQSSGLPQTQAYEASAQSTNPYVQNQLLGGQQNFQSQQNQMIPTQSIYQQPFYQSTLQDSLAPQQLQNQLGILPIQDNQGFSYPTQNEISSQMQSQLPDQLANQYLNLENVQPRQQIPSQFHQGESQLPFNQQIPSSNLMMQRDQLSNYTPQQQQDLGNQIYALQPFSQNDLNLESQNVDQLNSQNTYYPTQQPQMSQQNPQFQATEFTQDPQYGFNQIQDPTQSHMIDQNFQGFDEITAQQMMGDQGIYDNPFKQMQQTSLKTQQNMSNNNFRQNIPLDQQVMDSNSILKYNQGQFQRPLTQDSLESQPFRIQNQQQESQQLLGNNQNLNSSEPYQNQMLQNQAAPRSVHSREQSFSPLRNDYDAASNNPISPYSRGNNIDQLDGSSNSVANPQRPSSYENVMSASPNTQQRYFEEQRNALKQQQLSLLQRNPQMSKYQQHKEFLEDKMLNSNPYHSAANQDIKENGGQIPSQVDILGPGVLSDPTDIDGEMTDSPRKVQFQHVEESSTAFQDSLVPPQMMQNHSFNPNQSSQQPQIQNQTLLSSAQNESHLRINERGSIQPSNTNQAQRQGSPFLERNNQLPLIKEEDPDIDNCESDLNDRDMISTAKVSNNYQSQRAPPVTSNLTQQPFQNLPTSQEKIEAPVAVNQTKNYNATQPNSNPQVVQNLPQSRQNEQQSALSNQMQPNQLELRSQLQGNSHAPESQKISSIQLENNLLQSNNPQQRPTSASITQPQQNFNLKDTQRKIIVAPTKGQIEQPIQQQRNNQMQTLDQQRLPNLQNSQSQPALMGQNGIQNQQQLAQNVPTVVQNQLGQPKSSLPQKLPPLQQSLPQQKLGNLNEVGTSQLQNQPGQNLPNSIQSTTNQVLPINNQLQNRLNQNLIPQNQPLIQNSQLPQPLKNQLNNVQGQSQRPIQSIALGNQGQALQNGQIPQALQQQVRVMTPLSPSQQNPLQQFVGQPPNQNPLQAQLQVKGQQNVPLYGLVNQQALQSNQQLNPQIPRQNQIPVIATLAGGQGTNQLTQGQQPTLQTHQLQQQLQLLNQKPGSLQPPNNQQQQQLQFQNMKPQLQHQLQVQNFGQPQVLPPLGMQNGRPVQVIQALPTSTLQLGGNLNGSQLAPPAAHQQLFPQQNLMSAQGLNISQQQRQPPAPQIQQVSNIPQHLQSNFTQPVSQPNQTVSPQNSNQAAAQAIAQQILAMQKQMEQGFAKMCDKIEDIEGRVDNASNQLQYYERQQNEQLRQEKGDQLTKDKLNQSTYRRLQDPAGGNLGNGVNQFGNTDFLRDEREPRFNMMSGQGYPQLSHTQQNKSPQRTYQSKLTQTWSKVLDFVKQKKLEEAYRLTMKEADDIYLIRLIAQTGPVVKQLEDQTAFQVINRVNKILRSGAFEAMEIEWLEDANRRGLFQQLSKHEQNEYLDTLYQFSQSKLNSKISERASNVYQQIKTSSQMANAAQNSIKQQRGLSQGHPQQKRAL